ncbi:MAG: hypothetical protein U0517_03550 [Candidatus Andersenbacteria bacterium]
MARLLSITRSGATGSGLGARAGRTRALRFPVKLGPVTLTIVTVGLVGILALFFIMSTSTTSAEGFDLHTKEQQADQLREQNEQLEVDLSKLRSIDRLENSLKDSQLNFVPVTKVSTIRLSDETLAKAASNQ